MPRVSSSGVIPAPPHVVWTVLCDPRRFPEIAEPTDRMVYLPDDEFGEGYVYREYGGIAPFKSESEWKVTEFEPVHRQVHIGDDGQMQMHLEILLDRVESGTRVQMNVEMKPRGFMAPLAAVMWPLMMRQRAQAAMDQTVENLKEAVAPAHH